MKRPILGSLAAAIVSLGLLAGPSPARAATSNAPTAATVTPAHDTGDDHGHKYSHRDRQGSSRRHDRDHDHDGDRDRRKRCSGLIVVCLG